MVSFAPLRVLMNGVFYECGSSHCIMIGAIGLTFGFSHVVL